MTNIVFILYLFSRLREVGMPADYVNKLARMFQDVKVSEDLNQQFKETYRSTKGSIAGEMNICLCVYLKRFNIIQCTTQTTYYYLEKLVLWVRA